MRRLLLVGLALTLLAAACGDDGGGGGSTADGPVTVDAVQVAAREAPSGDPTIAGEATAAFGQDVFLAALADAEGDEDVVLSPLSILTALAMVEPGAVDEAVDQFHDVLHLDDPEAFRASLNALTQELEARVPEDFGTEQDPGQLAVRLANAAWLEQDATFEPAYLDTVGRFFGPVLNQVDFGANPDGVAHEINDWVAGQTEDRITDLVPDGTFDDATAFALVNALYLHASWVTPFEEGETRDGTFTTLDDAEVSVPMMHGQGDSSAEGEGWVAASKDYVGGLSMQFVLPDEGRFEEVAGELAEAFDALGGHGTEAALTVPRFETRTDVQLDAALQALGLTAPYDGGHLNGMVDDDRLVIDRTLHQTFVAVDEEGTEAAAATIVVGAFLSGPVSPPVDVVLDRPFYFRIVDQASGATLFQGRIMDPS